MRLADQLALCRTPFIVEDTNTKSQTRLMGAADFASAVVACPTRYTLSDDLVSLCAALAYSKGARSLACADLLRIPAQRVWIEWCEAPWIKELGRYGFRSGPEAGKPNGRRGAFIESCLKGRRGLIKTFWANGDTELDVLASNMEAYFDFDTEVGEEPLAPDGHNQSVLSVSHRAADKADILQRYFRFRYERSWQQYYDQAQLSTGLAHSIARHALGTVAVDIPMILAFFMLLVTRPGLPRRPLMLERLNQARVRAGKSPLLEHIEVTSPLLPEYRAFDSRSVTDYSRRGPRLHHVRGHLVRRGNQLSWRVPHLRGKARCGKIHSRTVTWTLDS